MGNTFWESCFYCFSVNCTPPDLVLSDPVLECWASWPGRRQEPCAQNFPLAYSLIPGWRDYKYLSLRRQAATHSAPSLLLRCEQRKLRMFRLRPAERTETTFLYGHQATLLMGRSLSLPAPDAASAPPLPANSPPWEPHAVLLGRTQSSLDETARAISAEGGKSEVIPCDVTVLHQLEYASTRVDSTFGRLDILVNNAGVGGFSAALHDLIPEDWDLILNTNLRGVFFAIKCFAPMMIRAYGGHIINISSLAGKNALPNGAAYAASKWVPTGLTYSVAEELAPAQHPRLHRLPRLSRHRTQPARGQRPQQDAPNPTTLPTPSPCW